MASVAKFAAIPVKYAPKRKMIDFSLPKWRNKVAEFEHPDVLSWVNNLYQDKTFKTQKDFNDAYDAGITEVLYWRNKPMILTKEDISNFENEFKDGAFDEVKTAAQKALTKMKALLETGEKTIYVY